MGGGGGGIRGVGGGGRGEEVEDEDEDEDTPGLLALLALLLAGAAPVLVVPGTGGQWRGVTFCSKF